MHPLCLLFPIFKIGGKISNLSGDELSIKTKYFWEPFKRNLCFTEWHACALVKLLLVVLPGGILSLSEWSLHKGKALMGRKYGVGRLATFDIYALFVQLKIRFWLRSADLPK